MILATAAQMKELDRRTIEELGMPGLVLMENAARLAVRSFRIIFLGCILRPSSAAKGMTAGTAWLWPDISISRGWMSGWFVAGSRKNLKGDAAHQFRLAE